MTLPTAKTLQRFFNRHMPKAMNAHVCYDRAELVRRLCRLQRVRLVAVKRFESVTLRDEKHLLYGVLSLNRSLEHYLASLILLKDSDGLKAWSQLVSAEERLTSALNHYLIDGAKPLVEGLTRLLKECAEVYFPQLVFSSVRYEFLGEHCSICGLAPLECEHQPFEFYDGRLCERVVDKMEILGIDFVEEPRNRRAVSYQWDGDGRTYNVFRGTSRPLTEAAEERDEATGLGILGHERGIVTSVPETNDPKHWRSVFDPLVDCSDLSSTPTVGEA